MEEWNQVLMKLSLMMKITTIVLKRTVLRIKGGGLWGQNCATELLCKDFFLFQRKAEKVVEAKIRKRSLRTKYNSKALIMSAFEREVNVKHLESYCTGKSRLFIWQIIN